MRKFVLALLLVFLCGSGDCIKVKADVDDADRDAILTSLAADLDKLTAALAGLEKTIDEQRAALTADVQQILAMTMVNMQTLIDQLKQALKAVDVSITNFQERLTADLFGAMTSLSLLTEQLRQGVHTDAVDVIREVSRQLDVQREITLHQLNAFVRETIRPTVAQLDRTGDKLVGRVVLGANVLVVRLIGGLLAAMAVLGLALAWRRLRGNTLSPVAIAMLGVLGVVLIGGFATATVLANPLARVGAQQVELPDGQAVCTRMSQQGRAFKAALGQSVRAPGASEASATAIGTRELAVRVLGGHRAAVVTNVAAKDFTEDAVALRLVAAECATYDPSGTFVDIAKEYITLAGAYLGERPHCTTDRDCTSAGRRCDARTGECLKLGDPYCREPNHCAPGFQCDSLNRCVPNASGVCRSPNDCRPEDACDPSLGRCVSIAEVTAAHRPCEVSTPGVSGPCKTGELRAQERWVRCVQTVLSSPEVCDGVDNNCNNSADEGLHRAEPCTAPGTGVCSTGGTFSCGGSAGWICTAAPASSEICDNKDNNCDGAIDNGVPSAGACRTGAGVCADRATFVCKGGAFQCVAGAGSAEVCDGADNDCDGSTDEGNVCCRPTTEVCDGADNDCDGRIDEGRVCDVPDDPIDNCPGSTRWCDCFNGCRPPHGCPHTCPDP